MYSNEMPMLNERGRAWTNLIVVVIGTCLIVLGIALGLQNGEGPTLGTLGFLLFGLGGIVTGVRRLRGKKAPRTQSNTRLLLIGLGFTAAATYLLCSGVNDLRDDAIASGVASIGVAIMGFLLGCFGVLGGLGVSLPHRRPSSER